MDDASYLMWPRRKLSSNSHHDHVLVCSTTTDSWEEQAFAEDHTAGLLGGGCIWPPRSYTCSFCGREFRSAQALGGHMNIHRRDRARLKLESTNHNSPPPPPPPVTQYSSQVCSLVYSTPKTNPNLIETHLSPSGSVFVPTSAQENYSEKGFNVSLPTIQEQPKVSTFQSLGASNLSIGRENFMTGCWVPKEMVRSNLAWSALRGSRMTSESGGEEEDAAVSSKRQKKDHPSSPFLIQEESANTFKLFPFCSMRPGLGEGNFLPSGVLGLGASHAMEDLDLELRLGDGPKVK